MRSRMTAATESAPIRAPSFAVLIGYFLSAAPLIRSPERCVVASVVSYVGHNIVHNRDGILVIIDCHGHYTTAPASHASWRERQLEAYAAGVRPQPYRLPAD